MTDPILRLNIYENKSNNCLCAIATAAARDIFCFETRQLYCYTRAIHSRIRIRNVVTQSIEKPQIRAVSKVKTAYIIHIYIERSARCILILLATATESDSLRLIHRRIIVAARPHAICGCRCRSGPFCREFRLAWEKFILIYHQSRV